MNYYILNESLDQKIVGKYPQVEEAHYYCDILEDPRFIDRVNFTFTTEDPIVAHAVLHKKAKLTDLISAGIAGFHLRLLLSGRFKAILQNHCKEGIQFYHTPLITKDTVIDDYWVLNAYELGFEFVDLAQSKVVIRKRKPEGGTFLENINFNTTTDFLNTIAAQNLEGKLYLQTIVFKPNITADFIALKYVEGGAKYLVSEKLKAQIEQEGLTGIEFQPSEISFNDWLSTGGERERLYGKV